MSVHAHVIMWQENTGSQATGSQAKQKKIKEIMKKTIDKQKIVLYNSIISKR